MPSPQLYYPPFHPPAPPWAPPPTPADRLIEAELSRERVTLKRALAKQGIVLPWDTPTPALVAVAKHFHLLPLQPIEAGGE